MSEKDQKLCVSIRIPIDRQGYEKHARFTAWRELSQGLFDFLISNRENGFSLFFHDEERQISIYEKEYRAWFEVFQVRRESMPIRMMKYEEMNWISLSSSAIGEINSRIRRFLRSHKGR